MKPLRKCNHIAVFFHNSFSYGKQLKHIIFLFMMPLLLVYGACGDDKGKQDWSIKPDLPAPTGFDALSASTNQSGRPDNALSEADGIAGACYIGQPQINNTGAVSISYPIEVPEGRAGIQPDVSLLYSSSSGDGLVGMGWNLSAGMGQISRDADQGQVYYDDQVSFTYNDDAMMKVSGSSSNENGIYRLICASDSSRFSRFELTDIENGGVWRVYDNAGTVIVFGEDSNSRIYKPEDITKTFQWHYSSTIDLNGNYMHAAYDQSEHDQNNVLYLTQISYTGNSNENMQPRQYVRFHYKERNHYYISKAPGFIMRMTKLLDAIEIGWDDAELWRYEMVYETSEDSKRPLLKTVESTHTSTNPEFIYQPAQHNLVWQSINNINYQDTETNPEATAYFEGDFNGDGISDMLFFNPDTGDWKAVERTPSGGYRFRLYGNKFQGYDNSSKIQWFKGDVTGDYNGDGRADVAFYLTKEREFWVAEHDGNIFQFKMYGRLHLTDVDIFSCEWFTGDFDANGLTDDVLFNERTGEWIFMKNNGGSFEFIKFSKQFQNLFRDDYSPDISFNSPRTGDITPQGRDRSKIHFLTGDYNGDGRTDISFYDERDAKWWVGENYRDDDIGSKLEWRLYKVFTAPEKALFGFDRFSGDFNGDGL